MYNHLENSLAFSGKCSCSYAAGYILSRNLYVLCTRRPVYKNIHSSTVHYSPKLETKTGDQANLETERMGK